MHTKIFPIPVLHFKYELLTSSFFHPAPPDFSLNKLATSQRDKTPQCPFYYNLKAIKLKHKDFRRPDPTCQTQLCLLPPMQIYYSH